ncbi:damage-control phosphatase ARMT1 family protein [Streptomyces albiaxialis]|uniref:Damage-control phosphatase ARMT1 family protein n=1 Tax=Streptomyces albiaxialis TaxID=329523 RepID=A0ABN2WJ47_9ACTN
MAAPEITSSDPDGFPYGVWHERHPALFERLKGAFPFSSAQRAALDALLEETRHGSMEPLPDDAPGAALWNGAWDRGHYGKRWTDAPFLWAESYFYRRLRGAVGYHAPEGAWRGIDPFGPFKDAELAGDAVDEQLASLDELDRALVDEKTDALLLAALWGNRADLGFLLTAEEEGGDRPLVADEREALRALLRDGGGRVSLVADNAGRELIPDLLLAAHLLGAGRAAEVRLHIKPHPYYVSDATTADVLAALRRTAAAPGAAGRAGHLLWRALEDGRLTLDAHPFFCAPLGYAEMPDDLRADFASSALTLMKGDLNYRRLVGDRHWPATVPFAEVTAHFPGPVAALRTLKSDVATGLTASTVAALDAADPEWRTNGAHALIQVRAPVAGAPGGA